MPFSSSPIASAEAQGTSSGATTSAIDTTGADLLVVVVTSYLGAAEPTLSDSKGNTWAGLSTIGDGISNTCRTRIYYAKNPTVGSGHTFSVSGTSSFPGIAVSAWSGADLTAPFDQESVAEADLDTTSLATGSVTPTESSELLVAGWGHGAAGTPDSPSVNSGFTIEGSLTNVTGTSFGVTHAYLVQGSAAAVNPTLSWGSASSGTASIATFKAASPPPAPDIGRFVTVPDFDSAYREQVEADSRHLAPALYLPVPPPPPPPPLTPAPTLNPVAPPADGGWQAMIEAHLATISQATPAPLTNLPPTPLPQAGRTGKGLIPRDPLADVPTRRALDRISDILNSLMSEGRLNLFDRDGRWTVGGGIIATRPPAAGDDITVGALPGMMWVNTASQKVWICASNTTGAAVWVAVN